MLCVFPRVFACLSLFVPLYLCVCVCVRVTDDVELLLMLLHWLVTFCFELNVCYIFCNRPRLDHSTAQTQPQQQRKECVGKL